MPDRYIVAAGSSFVVPTGLISVPYDIGPAVAWIFKSKKEAEVAAQWVDSNGRGPARLIWAYE